MIQPDAADIAELLGLPESAAGPPSCCPVSSLKALMITVDDCDLLTQALSPTTLRRRKGHLDEEESQRLYRVARAWLMARRVFGNESRACQFLSGPHTMLAGETPIVRAAAGAAGIENVEQLLGRLYYGSAA